MLGPRSSFESRSEAAAGPLAPLAASLARDLDRLLPDDDVFVPAEKAKMTRDGGRCPRDGAFLEFDPRSPRQHRCPTCETVYDSEHHYLWWVMGYQLWLAERSVHASALWRVTGEERFRRLAEAILSKLADRYLAYPNEDNVLGPTRVFFSTYLESIWSLQLSVAVSLLESNERSRVGERVRERILVPSSELVRSFSEGLSNRQVWNSAALGASGVLLQRPELVERSLFGPGGLEQFLRSGLLEDGTWYEGENYHLFAHRGLWYLVMLAEHAGVALPPDLLARFDLGFVAPLKTALPDFTFPSRRDSQYRASLRQWRIAESLELGLARSPGDVELAGGLRVLYSEAHPGDAGRWRSTAEAERNLPGVRLTRADLGWKALLFAQSQLPHADKAAPRSALLEGQGFGVVRRDDGNVYVALDYGHTGGSHGHPDRLNLWLVIGNNRVFEDVGTGSYVERTLHWYRSTLAHNAPLIDGRSQDPVAGRLRAWEEHDGFAWIDAEAPVAKDVLVRRTLVVGREHIVDRLEWTAASEVTLDLPMHTRAMLHMAAWAPGRLEGGNGLEDGFEFIIEAEKAAAPEGFARILQHGVSGAVQADTPYEWWSVLGPGPPGFDIARFLLLRARGKLGLITSVWSWGGPVSVDVAPDGAIEVSVADQQFSHRLAGETWRVKPPDAAEVVLDGHRPAIAQQAPAHSIDHSTRQAQKIPVLHARDGDVNLADQGLRFELGEANYRRTEATWLEAGSPTATVTLASTRSELLIEVSVNASEPHFAASMTENPLDNENPDTNSDGVQIHLAAPSHEPASTASWLLVPEPGTSTVRISARGNAPDISLRASWARTHAGWRLLARVPRSALGQAGSAFGLDVIVNAKPAWRERRRGQLVLSGGGEWAWLRGDRQELARLLPFTVAHG